MHIKRHRSWALLKGLLLRLPQTHLLVFERSSIDASLQIDGLTPFFLKFTQLNYQWLSKNNRKNIISLKRLLFNNKGGLTVNP